MIESGLRPAPPADKRTWLRRVSFDLVGLPPTPEEIEAFLSDDSPEKPGFHHGATDDYGYYAVQDRVHFHDLHATILNLLGLDHWKLTYRYAGRDFRLTDVHGEVVHKIIA